MSSTAGDEDQGGLFGAKGVRTCGLLLSATFSPVFMKRSSESSVSKCEDFADHFRSKIDGIRSLLSKDQNLHFFYYRTFIVT